MVQTEERAKLSIDIKEFFKEISILSEILDWVNSLEWNEYTNPDTIPKLMGYCLMFKIENKRPDDIESMELLKGEVLGVIYEKLSEARKQIGKTVEGLVGFKLPDLGEER